MGGFAREQARFVEWQHIPQARDLEDALNARSGSKENNLPFVFKLDSIDNKQVLCAWLVDFGLPSCIIGYIPSSTIPSKALHHILQSVYQIVFAEADVDANTNAHGNLEVLKGVCIGKALNILLNSN